MQFWRSFVGTCVPIKLCGNTCSDKVSWEQLFRQSFVGIPVPTTLRGNTCSDKASWEHLLRWSFLRTTFHTFWWRLVGTPIPNKFHGNNFCYKGSWEFLCLLSAATQDGTNLCKNTSVQIIWLININRWKEEYTVESIIYSFSLKFKGIDNWIRMYSKLFHHAVTYAKSVWRFCL